MGDGSEVDRWARVFLPQDELFDAMEFGAGEDASEITDHAAVTLNKEALIDAYGCGGIEYTGRLLASAPAPGFVFTPTPFGLQLFLWAQGHAL